MALQGAYVLCKRAIQGFATWSFLTCKRSTMSSFHRIQLRPALDIALNEILTSPLLELVHFYLVNYLLSLLVFILSVVFDTLYRILIALWRLFIVSSIVYIIKLLLYPHHSEKDDEESEE